MKRVFVCCPGGTVTGGPELIHQFVDCLNRKGVDAKVLYYPFDKEFGITAPYAKYQVSVGSIANVQPGDVVVLPEVATRLCKSFEFCSKIYVWWLSVDNYLAYKRPGPNRGMLRHYIQVVQGLKLSLTKMKSRNFAHLVQSQYAKDYLASKGISSSMLSDYLGPEHLEQQVDLFRKERFVAYNPKKGLETTRRLISAAPDIEFVPIQNMTSSEVKALLQRAMVYIDFGTHPGKDRFPREAAMAGCCVITGMQGSAKNTRDVPVPNKFKINEKISNFEVNVVELIGDIFCNFGEYHEQFECYRASILGERAQFEKDVDVFLQSL